jgi:hypothetical protein
MENDELIGEGGRDAHRGIGHPIFWAGE